MIDANTIGSMLDELRAAALVLADADAQVHQASTARADAEEVFLAISRALNLLLSEVVTRAEQGADWHEEKEV